GLCFFADCVYFESDFTFKLTITKDLYFVGSADQPVGVKCFEAERFNVVFFLDRFNLAKIENLIFNSVDIVESSLRQAALNWHLSTFMRVLSLVTCTALSTLVTFC